VSAWHDRVEAVAWAPSGRWGYVAEDADGARVVLNGVTVARGPWASDLALGKDGRYVYVMGEADGAVVVHDGGSHRFDIVLGGSLQYLDGGRAWACLSGDRRRQELFVVVNGVALERLDWAAITRGAQRGDDESIVRHWVAARAEAAWAERHARGSNAGRAEP
jgi:hypothetical protein